MSTNSPAAPPTTASGLDSLAWLVGSWQGSLGPQTVEETWSVPRAGSMEACIRLSAPEGVQMIELIVIREVPGEGGATDLALHLRQFTPALELVTSQDMQREAFSADETCFVADDGANIKRLIYRQAAPGRLEADVVFAGGDAATAQLEAV
jgi:hypothetical protein